MKNIIYKLSFLLLGFALVVACESPEGETNYTPAEYISPSTFSIAIDATSLTDTTSELIYTPTAVGEGFYAVTNANAPTPTSTQVHDGSFSGALQTGSFDVDGSTPVMSILDTGLYGGYEYNVHAIHKSADNFISENVVTTSFTTPDTMDPVIVSFSPEHGTGFYEFDNQSITFTFSEPVKYVTGSDFNFGLFVNGVGFIDNFTITDPALSLGGDVFGDYATEITISGWDGSPGAFTIIDFIAGVFVDSTNAEVPAIATFDYYFLSRDQTQQEVTDLLLGDWNYTITNNAFNPAVLSGTSGTWSVTAGTNPNTIILTNQLDHDINSFLGVDDSATREFEVTVGENNVFGNGVGGLYLAAHESGVTVDLWGDGTQGYWTAYYEDSANLELAGFYDLTNKVMQFRVDFGSALGWLDSAHYFGDIQYDYTYVPGTGGLGRQAQTSRPIGPTVSDMILTTNDNSLKVNDYKSFSTINKNSVNLSNLNYPIAK